MQDTYVVDKFNQGEVHTQDGAVGWLMSDGEFRPLMSDAVEQLVSAGLINTSTAHTTATAREAYVERSLAEYRQAQLQRTPEQIAEERFEARAAMGPGVKMVNMFTGEQYTT